MQKDNISTWSHAPVDLGLQPHQVDIWRVFLDLPDDTVKSLFASLSADETQRAARFHFPADRDRFLIAHGCLRDVLSHYLRCEPDQLNFSTGEYGKPILLSDKYMNFNLSHSGDYALIAVTRERKVGIDVERIRQRVSHEGIARRYFSQGEISELVALPPEERRVAFFNGWARKEAYIKAHGLGLSLPLDSFDVSLTPNEAAILRATRPDQEESARWTLISLAVDPDYAGALAVEGSALSLSKGQGLEFRLWDWKTGWK
jgi:4'-phosphopantetheinyl transferase